MLTLNHSAKVKVTSKSASSECPHGYFTMRIGQPRAHCKIPVFRRKRRLHIKTFGVYIRTELTIFVFGQLS